MQHPEHGEHTVPGKGRRAPGRFVDAEREVVLPQVERGLAGAGCKQHGEAPVFPAVDFQFLFIIFQDMRVLAAHVMQDAPEQRQAVLHFLVPEIREFPKPLHVPGNVLRQRLVGKHLEVAPENRHQRPEALISGLLRQGVGDGRQLDRHLHLAVEEQALALHDEDHLRVLRAFLEGRVGVGFSPVPQVPDDEFEAEQGFRGLLVQFLVQIPHHEFAFFKRGVREEEAQIVGHPGFGNLGPDRGGHRAEQGRRDCAAGPRRFGPCGKAESFQIQSDLPDVFFGLSGDEGEVPLAERGCRKAERERQRGEDGVRWRYCPCVHGGTSEAIPVLRINPVFGIMQSRFLEKEYNADPDLSISY